MNSYLLFFTVSSFASCDYLRLASSPKLASILHAPTHTRADLQLHSLRSFLHPSQPMSGYAQILKPQLSSLTHLAPKTSPTTLKPPSDVNPFLNISSRHAYSWEERNLMQKVTPLQIQRNAFRAAERMIKEIYESYCLLQIERKVEICCGSVINIL